LALSEKLESNGGVSAHKLTFAAAILEWVLSTLYR
jgi:hypothetical protein